MFIGGLIEGFETFQVEFHMWGCPIKISVSLQTLDSFGAIILFIKLFSYGNLLYEQEKASTTGQHFWKNASLLLLRVRWEVKPFMDRWFFFFLEAKQAFTPFTQYNMDKFYVFFFKPPFHHYTVGIVR